ncbi:MAG: hypothetical protein GY895_04665 [Phycisphaera sp.]|nr:hypothetical protein [Phycisphaera sp.]
MRLADMLRHAQLAGLVLIAITTTANAQSEAETKLDAQSLGGEIKAASLLGLIDGEEARKLYFEILELQYGDGDSKEEKEADADWDEDDKRRGGMTFSRFLVRDGGDFTTLMRPEFLRRDIEPLSNAVGGDQGLVAVIESLLEDYELAFEARRSAFEASLDVASTEYELAMIDESLGRIPDVPISRTEIERRLEGMNEGKGLGGRDPGKVAEWGETQIAKLQARIQRLRGILATRRAASENDGAPPSARELLAMMESLRQERDELRRVLETDLRSVVPSRMLPDTEAALDRIRLEHGRDDARFGGSGIDLDLAVRRTELPAKVEASVLSDLAEANREIADLVDARTAARIERETKAARLLAAEIEGDEARLQQRTKAVMAAADREIAAGLAVRDAILGQMGQIHGSLLPSDPESAADFIRIARKDGFPDQMRRRWCERALEAAILIPEMDEAMLEAILELQFYVIERLTLLQDQAIKDRLQLEPRLGRAMVDGLEDDFAGAKGMGEETWREPGFEQFDRLDDEIGRRLLAILGPGRVETLPRHASLGTLAEEKSDGRKGDGRKGDGRKGTGGKSGDKGRGGRSK